MPHVSFPKSQVKKQGQMSKSDILKKTPESTPRDDLRSAYSGDENRGPARNQKKGQPGHRTKGARLRRASYKTPVR